MSVIRADGQLAGTGGKVVKNVAGYDLCKLYAGSYRTSVTVRDRLSPPPGTRSCGLGLSAARGRERCNKSSAWVVVLTACSSSAELDWPATNGPIELSVLFEGLTGSVEQRCGIALGMVGTSAAIRSSAPPWWATLPGPTTLKATTTISGVGRSWLSRGCGRLRRYYCLDPVLSWTWDSVYIGLSEDSEPEMVDYLLRRLRDHFQKTGGSVVVLRASAEIRAAVDVWGPVGALELMRRVKANFDPAGLLAPGRFVGGI